MAASQVAERLDTEVLGLLRQATGVPASAPAGDTARPPSSDEGA
jgi:hypothetical protein